MIIATNSSFSNPTRDWVKGYNARRIGPNVELWDRRQIQELVKRYPAAAAETMVAALDFQTRVDFLAAYFYESGRILTEAELADCWNRRTEISSPAFLLAACYADSAADN